ncbi:MAG: amidotransferase 1, exosortase A system-associated [Gammaproteobacteria bacterium]|nr:amidotransferase 1, exosortase A system-associated [Gammaproteobacteria bacterium]
MCGLVGIFDLRDGARGIDRDLLERMNDRQLHRGPDESGLHVEAGVGLGHRRLSIIDLASGQQPLFNEDHSVVVVYNGEIYNFPELSEQLAAAGHTFRTHCDTEVIVHAWEQWGEACVERFRGMFAFALWDRNRRTLFLARDRMGIKPLLYTLTADGLLLFASELKALLAHRAVLRDIDPRAVEDYFTYGYIPEPKTIFRGVHKLPAGHVIACVPGKSLPAPRRYWDLPFEMRTVTDPAAVREELIARLEEAVRIRLIAEVPLGAFLSGGVDSSAVVGLMAKVSPDPVNTCAISFGDPRYNEAAYAQRVADQFGTRHSVDRIDVDDFSLLDRLGELYDEPFADSSALPTYRVCELARRHVTVALSGDGGDENFAGYKRYGWHMAEERLRGVAPLGLRRPLFGLLGRLYPAARGLPRVFRAKATLEALGRDDVDGYRQIISLLGDGPRAQLFSAAFRRELQGYSAGDVLREHAARAPTDDPLLKVVYLDFKTYLVDDILTKVDRASMAHSLEVRVPLLDHKFVEWVSGLPAGLRREGGEGKAIFKKALAPMLPNDILYRPKQGFAVPVAEWFRGPLREHLQRRVLGPELQQLGIFDPSALRRLVDEHLSGRFDRSAALWALAMFESFQRRALA